MGKINFYSLITIVFSAILFTSCASRVETEEPQAQIPDEQINAGLKTSDELFTQREDAAKLRQAVETLAKIRDMNRRNFEVEWKFSRDNYFLSKQTDSDEEAEQLLKDGSAAGIIASRIEPEKPDGHFWYGANLGRTGETKSCHGWFRSG